jgi:hypothetical protein
MAASWSRSPREPPSPPGFAGQALAPHLTLRRQRLAAAVLATAFLGAGPSVTMVKIGVIGARNHAPNACPGAWVGPA